MNQETYYYGQGKVFLAKRSELGQPLAWRWVGDVDALSIALSVESFDHKESYSGQRAAVRRIHTGKEGTINSTWYEYSPENLATLLYGGQVIDEAGTVTGEALPENIKAGDRFSLQHQQVSTVVVGALVEGTDYTVDPEFGAIEFLTDQAGPTTVNYSHGSAINSTMFTEQVEELAMRYEGINLAENGAKVVVELYKLKFDPVAALNLINTDTSLSGLETTAGILMDTQRPTDSVLGRYGRIIHIGSAT
ncbi:hypothetical protein I2492_06070 [Budviciaceae bacterium CWB-B4]|uniref:Uncharacterized protein n=1 Tax=Limnobaculum xujianqingii TaxID=2738837 RepID=A0A9D7AH75_9GAMM|nr:hypothetical protein [Limnobaculum xujianqingii]MBK5072575.1 hypothetical protein [Limnobaculum xujianqingii]MBK5175884.1 hypothetical protein [Limnobaculum xujianqingii]